MPLSSFSGGEQIDRKGIKKLCRVSGGSQCSTITSVTVDVNDSRDSPKNLGIWFTQNRCAQFVPNKMKQPVTERHRK
jgi:hypothetical protein